MNSKSRLLQFSCQKCNDSVAFSLTEVEKPLSCPKCQTKYAFDDPVLKRQLAKFVTLCTTIQDSEEILSDTQVGIDVADHHVEVPFKLLLTRLNTTLDLKIDNKPLKIAFRIEPLMEKKS